MEATTTTETKIDFELTGKSSENLFGKPRFRGHDGLVEAKLPLPGDRKDMIKYNSSGYSIRDMIKMISEKFNLAVILDISDYEAGFLDPQKAGIRIGKMTSIESLTEEDIYGCGWERATGAEALEIVLLLMLQADEKRANHLLEPYLADGFVMLCSTNNWSDDFVTLEIDKKNKIIIMSQVRKNEIMTKALKGEKNINSIWLLEIDEKKF